MKNKIIDILIILLGLFCLLTMAGTFFSALIIRGNEISRAAESRQSQAVTDQSLNLMIKWISLIEKRSNAYDARISRLEKECKIPDVRPCSVTTCTLRIDKEK